MSRRGGFRTRLIVAVAALAGLLAAPPAARAGTVAERAVDGIRLIALKPSHEAPFDISVLPPDEGLERIAAALRLILRKSPSNAAAIRRLKADGTVTLVYYPNHFRDRIRLNTQTVALFVPGFLKDRGLGGDGRNYAVVINQFGVKWPSPELAAVIAHELAGHGLQQLEGRIASGRLLDLECEASLYQEQAYQDLGVPKKGRTVVLFRRQMEFRYCADFRGFMKARAPKSLPLWDSLNPEVPTLLSLFRDYRGTQSAAARTAPPPNARTR